MSAATDDVREWVEEVIAAPTPEALAVFASFVIREGSTDAPSGHIERLLVDVPTAVFAGRARQWHGPSNFAVTGDGRGGWACYQSGMVGTLPEVLLGLACWIAQ